MLAGYQCGTVYKPIYLEAQAAVALALYLRAGSKPPASLVNGKTQDTTANVSVPSVLVTPKWVTTANMNATVVKDNFVPAAAAVRRFVQLRLHRGGHHAVVVRPTGARLGIVGRKRSTVQAGLPVTGGGSAIGARDSTVAAPLGVAR